MSDDERLAQLEAENARLKEELAERSRVAARAVASYQQRALQMEIIRQQNEDLDRLAQELAKAKDLEERRAREIEQGARLKSEFLANFSHEIRTPLNGIIGYCDLLSREEGERLTLHGRRDLGTIKSNAKILLDLINDILDLSKIESGHVDVVREVVDMERLVDECLATVHEVLKPKNVAANAHVGPDARWAFLDPLKIRQIVLNLLSNAAKFTDIGEVAINLSAEGRTLIIEVEDTGCGISSEDLPHVFQKFRQVDGSRSRRKGGTGLGLAIVRELTRILDGDVDVESVLGRGSTFRVVLPDCIEQAPAQTAKAKSDSPSDLPVGAQVLVIDDDPLIQQLLRRKLEDEGFEVTLAVDGQDGLAAARRDQPTAIVLDIHLPRVDGWSVLSRLKSDPELKQIPVIILSIEEDRNRGFSLGAFDYLIKPVEPNTLVDVLRTAIAPDEGEVLVVDDDADTRALVSRRLRAEGFSVSEAVDGSDALVRIRVAPPALMVLDLVMPNVDGFEVLAHVRNDGHQFPVVVLSGKDLTATESAALRDGLARVIRKNGTSTEQVVEQAKAHVVRRRALQAAKRPVVLYVEDIEQNRDIVRRYLAGVFELAEASDGPSGLRLATKIMPDLILMDLSLPQLDGWEVTKRLKADPKLEDIPVVALTAHATRQDMDLATEAGCCDYLTKPVDRGRLIGTIRRHLQGGSERAIARADGR